MGNLFSLSFKIEKIKTLKMKYLILDGLKGFSLLISLLLSVSCRLFMKMLEKKRFPYAK